jgi:hypothetical protein
MNTLWPVFAALLIHIMVVSPPNFLKSLWPTSRQGRPPAISNTPTHERIADTSGATVTISDPVSISAPPSLPNEPYGMFEIANNPETPTSVDVVAVHGLQGHAFKTWTFDNGNMWLRDELPDNVPAARVLTFGYDSTIAFSRSVATIEDIALQLLTALHMERESDKALGTRRPIVFVCHSLGGIVVKKALVLANERSSDVGFKDILDNTRAIAFLAVPHRGSATANWMQILADTLKAGSLGTTTNKAVLEGLRKNSPMLRDISKQFVERGKDLQIYTFYELEKIAGMPSRVSTLLHWRTLRVVMLVPGCR